MRRRLVVVFLAISTLVATAFVVPLGFLVRRTAEDRAVDAARADAASILPALVVDTPRDQVEAAVMATSSGTAGNMTVVTSEGWTIGPEVLPNRRVDAALTSGVSSIGDTDGGLEVVTAVASGPDELSAIRVFVSDADRREGQWRAWAVLALVGATLVAISVLVADRLSRTIVNPTRELAAAARQLGDGDLRASVRPDGPSELVELAAAFNELGSQVSTMLAHERELVAELSHRLRTPLTKLRLRLEQVEDPALVEELRTDLDELAAAVSGVIVEARGTLAVDHTSDAGRVVAARVEFWRVLAEDQDRGWDFTGCEEAAPVGLPSAKLAAAVDVMLENVFVHTPEGSPVAVGVEVTERHVTIWVADAGDGIDPQLVERGASGGGSTGLGLDIARSTAEDIGGSFAIEPGHLGGAKVSLRLPRAESPPK